MVVSTPPRPPIDTTTNDDPNNDNNNGHNNIDEAVETEHSGVKVNIMNNPNSYCGGSPRVFFGPIRPIEFPLNTLDMNRRKTLVMGVVPVSGFSCSDVTAAAVVEELGGGDGGDDDDDDNDSNDDDVVFQPQQRPRIPTPSLPSTQTATSVHITPPTNLLLSDWILTQIIRWRQRAAAPRLNASEVACLRIQAAIRMWSARTRFLGLRQSLVRLQRKWRAVRAQLALSSRAAASATKIQRFWRQRLVFLELKRNLALQFQVESAAARRIQACWSNLVSRRNQLMTITTLHRILSNISARKIQLAWRRNIAVMLAEASNRRIKLEACRRSVACTLIQRCWRQYHERHSAAKLIQRSWKSYQRSLQLHHAVSIIQTWWIRFRRSCSSSIVSRGSQLPFPVSSSSFPSSSSSSVMKLDQQEQLQQASLYASDKTVSEYSSPVTPVLESAATPMTPSTSSLLTIPASTKSTGGLNLNLKSLSGLSAEEKAKALIAVRQRLLEAKAVTSGAPTMDKTSSSSNPLPANTSEMASSGIHHQLRTCHSPATAPLPSSSTRLPLPTLKQEPMSPSINSMKPSTSGGGSSSSSINSSKSQSSSSSTSSESAPASSTPSSTTRSSTGAKKSLTAAATVDDSFASSPRKSKRVKENPPSSPPQIQLRQSSTTFPAQQPPPPTITTQAEQVSLCPLVAMDDSFSSTTSSSSSTLSSIDSSSSKSSSSLFLDTSITSSSSSTPAMVAARLPSHLIKSLSDKELAKFTRMNTDNNVKNLRTATFVVKIVDRNEPRPPSPTFGDRNDDLNSRIKEAKSGDLIRINDMMDDDEEEGGEEVARSEKGKSVAYMASSLSSSSTSQRRVNFRNKVAIKFFDAGTSICSLVSARSSLSEKYMRGSSQYSVISTIANSPAPISSNPIIKKSCIRQIPVNFHQQIPLPNNNIVTIQRIKWNDFGEEQLPLPQPPPPRHPPQAKRRQSTISSKPLPGLSSNKKAKRMR